MLTREKLTVDEFWDFCQREETETRHFELIDGEPVEMSPSSPASSAIGLRIGRKLDEFVEEHNLGIVTGENGGYIISAPDGQLFAPDAGYVPFEQVKDDDPNRFFKTPPALAVEVISPSDTYKATIRKARSYIEYGTRLVWVVDPSDSTVTTLRLVNGVIDIREFGLNETLDGFDVLPGFTIPISQLFPKLKP